MARPRPRNLSRGNSLLSVLSCISLAQWAVLALTLTLVGALLVVSGRRQSYGSNDLTVQPALVRSEDARGNEVQFMESQQNLKHSNLLEIPIEDSHKIFKGRPSPDTGSSSIDLNKNGNGFLSNVAEAKKGAVESVDNVPAVESKPLGFYFSKDAQGHVKENAQSTRHKFPSALPTGGKAAIGMYFNKDSKQPNLSDTSGITHQSDAVRTESDNAASQRSGKDRSMSAEQQSAGSAGGVTAESGRDRLSVKDTRHRKDLRGISMGIQLGQGASLDNVGKGQRKPVNIVKQSQTGEQGFAHEADDSSGSSLVIAINSSGGQFKPSKKRTSLNTDDM